VIPLDSITRARETLRGVAVRTPLVRLRLADVPAEIHLKLECLQPIGSFKIRGAMNAMAEAPPEALARGVVTASAGNMAQGVAWGARERGVPCTVVVPDTAPQTKLDDRVMAGNGTIGLEILEDLPDVDAVLIPWGGGGLTSGIASALKQLRPGVRVIAVEPETGAPLTASLRAGESRGVDFTPSFVDGSGSRALLPKMWDLAYELVDAAAAVSLDETAAAVRLLAERARVVAEGAGGLSLAAARAGHGGTGRVVCIVSGGNIDSSRLAKILAGETPA
jgi:threonine dehydratase